jgi:hypothetical protein
MKKLHFLLVMATAGLAGAAEPPAQAKAIIEAAKKAGLLVADDFSTKVLSSDELASLKKEIPKHDWIAEIPGLGSTLTSNYPAEIGMHKSSGFRLAIYHSGDKIMLLSCSVPLVNGGQKEQKEMIETMMAATEALVGSNTGVRPWLDAEWQRAWEISAKLFDKAPVDQKEIIRKKEVGPFLVTVWGVVPDIVFLNCVRRATRSSETTTPSGRGSH